VQRYLGGGKYAEVHLATDRDLEATDGGDPRVAIKVLRPDYWQDEEAIERLQREGWLQRTERLGSHNKIVRVLRESVTEPLVSPLDGRAVAVPLLIMEYVEHVTLEEYLRKHGGVAPVDDVLLSIVQQLGSALDWIHSRDQRVIHRDLASHNVMLRSARHEEGPLTLLSGQEDFVQLSDFGLAFVEGEEPITQDRRDRIAANLRYASPQILYGAVPTVQDDIFSFGALVYKMLVGHLPFPGGKLETIEDLWDYAELVGERPVMFPDPDAIDEAVEEILIRALDSEREKRYASAGEMKDALIGALTRWREPERAAGVSPPVAAEDTPSSSGALAVPVLRTEDASPPAEGRRTESAREAAEQSEETGKGSKKVRGCCLWRFVGLLALVGLVVALLVVGAVARWWPLTGAREGTPTVQLQPITSDSGGPVETQLPPEDDPQASPATATAEGVPALLTPEVSPAQPNPTDVPAAALENQVEGVKFAYVTRSGGETLLMAQPRADGEPGYPLVREAGDLRSPVWSPNDDLLAYVIGAGEDAAVYVTDGITTRRLSPPGLSEGWPSWSRDGNALVVATQDGEGSHLSYIDVASGDHAPLTGSLFNAWAPAWSPTEDSIAFVSDIEGAQDLYLWSLEAPDRSPVNVSRTGDVVRDSPAWAPDGKWLIYATSGGLRWVSVENMEPGTPRTFTESGQDRAPCFLNEREVLFQRTSGAGTVSIYQGRLGNAAQERLIDSALWPVCRR
jgi:serine/threonine protein kinase